MGENGRSSHVVPNPHNAGKGKEEGVPASLPVESSAFKAFRIFLSKKKNRRANFFSKLLRNDSTDQIPVKSTRLIGRLS